MAYKVQKTDASGVWYADPSVPGLTVRFKTGRAIKSIDGLQFTNVVTEIIYNDDPVITVGSETVKDAVSVRLRASGALESSAALSELLLSLAAQIATWDTESVFGGFPPATAPVIPAPAGP